MVTMCDLRQQRQRTVDYDRRHLAAVLQWFTSDNVGLEI